MATEPQRLTKKLKSVSDRLLSLFTRTSPEKLRSPETTQIPCFLPFSLPNRLCRIAVRDDHENRRFVFQLTPHLIAREIRNQRAIWVIHDQCRRQWGLDLRALNVGDGCLA